MYRGGLSRNRALDKSIADYNEAIRLDPKDAQLYVYRGAVFAQKSDFAKADADVKVALALDPKSEEARGLAEWIKQLAGKKAEKPKTVPQTKTPKRDLEFENIGNMFK